MLIYAQIGFLTTVLELTATSVGEGVVIGGFLAACAGVLTQRSRVEREVDTLRSSFWGGLWGIFCLCFDLLIEAIR